MTRPSLPDRPVDEAASLASVEAGGLPLRAQRRIAELHASGSSVFTSTLDASETVVARATGLSALSQVMGSSVFHVGFGQNRTTSYYGGWDSGGEVEVLTQAHAQARSLALGRMHEEARLLGAHVVLDVKFGGRGFEWSRELIEITAVGTAMRIEGAPPTNDPALAMLEADQLYKLHATGYWPAGIAMGGCYYLVRHADCEGLYIGTDLPAHGLAASTARGLAVERFRAAAASFAADGVVGAFVHKHGRDEEWETNDVHHRAFHYQITIAGTAIRRIGPGQSYLRPPRIVVDLRDRA